MVAYRYCIILYRYNMFTLKINSAVNMKITWAYNKGTYFSDISWHRKNLHTSAPSRWNSLNLCYGNHHNNYYGRSRTGTAVQPFLVVITALVIIIGWKCLVYILHTNKVMSICTLTIWGRNNHCQHNCKEKKLHVYHGGYHRSEVESKYKHECLTQ